MNHNRLTWCRRARQCAPRAAIILQIAALGVALLAGAAKAQGGVEIVLVIGQGERRAMAQAPWTAAAAGEKVGVGSFVRTLANSQMALYLPDRSQVRLNQNSMLEIKAVADAAPRSETRLDLSAGRAWSQAKPRPIPGDAAAQQARFRIHTPTATIGIRGTDWELEVGPEGQTQLVVLSGVVDMSNERGALSVGAGEAALAQAGLAPVKLTLVNPASRVQWVSSWRPQPRRWVPDAGASLAAAVASIEAGDYAGGAAQLRPAAPTDPRAATLLADVLIHQGDLEGAAAVLAPHLGAAAPQPAALLARVLARQDKMQEAGRLLAGAVSRSPADVELLLAQGELALLDGDAAGARRAFEGVLAVSPRNVEAWYGIGLIESERENVRQARRALNEALRADPASSRAAGELAATETFAGNLATARSMLEALLAREPANYSALTALGINKLKGGRPDEGLADFLKAGVVEPRYARARLYAGVAYYQLGEPGRAREEFDHAARLDPRDPVPHVYESMVLTDRLEYGNAIAAAREAQQRMPYLRSLNQVASNQKGNANLGSALANFGMEEWAGYYAAAAASPYWGGSHLFLADRYTGKFNRNSELFQGFLTDPTSFGASSRQSSLVAAPGHHGRVDLFWERTDWSQAAAIGTLNGLATQPFPIAYYFSGDVARAGAVKDDSAADGRNGTLGLGVKPRHDLAVFLFATDSKLDATLRSAALPDDGMAQTERRVDLGLNFKLRSDNQFWLKGGSGRQGSDVAGVIVSDATADALNAALGRNIVSPMGVLDGFNASGRQRDWQFRHAFGSGDLQWAWGAERSHQDRAGRLDMTFRPLGIGNEERLALRATDVWLSARQKFAQGHALQADLFRQTARIDRTDASTLAVLGRPPVNIAGGARTEHPSELNPRLGAVWQIGPLQSVRMALQKWRRPASVGTLSPVDTAGIALNDRLPAAGGEYRRARVQLEGELSPAAFGQVFLDQERVDNGLAGQRSPVSDFELTQLESLRNRPDIFSARSDLEETPRFAEGRVRSLGLAVNHLVSRSQSLSLRYVRRHARQTGARQGLDVPFIPRDYLQLGAQWALPDRWLVGTSGIYRGSRYRDDANLEVLEAGWAMGLTVFWESADKRSSVQGILDNLLTRSGAGTSNRPHLLLRYSYSFGI